MEAYCISQEKFKNKWNETLVNIRENGFPGVKIFPAVEGSEQKNNQLLSVWARYNLLNGIYRKCHEQFTTWGSVGCYLSHVSLWQYMVNKNLDKMAIFEDDVIFSEGAKEKIDSLLQSIPDDADMVALGVLWNEIHEPYNDKLDRINGQFFGLHAYILTNKGAKKFLQEVFPMEIQLDSYMSFVARMNDMKLYTSWGICSQGGRATTIQNSCTICFYDENFSRLLLVSLCILIIWLILNYIRK